MFSNPQIHNLYILGTNLVLSSPAKTGKSKLAEDMINGLLLEKKGLIITNENIIDINITETYDLIVIDDYNKIVKNNRKLNKFNSLIENFSNNPHIVILTRGMDYGVDKIAKKLRSINIRPCIGMVFPKATDIKYYYSYPNGYILELGIDCLNKKPYEKLLSDYKLIIDTKINYTLENFIHPSAEGSTMFHIPHDKCRKIFERYKRDNIDKTIIYCGTGMTDTEQEIYEASKRKVSNYYFSDRMMHVVDHLVITDIKVLMEEYHECLEYATQSIILADKINLYDIPYMFLDEDEIWGNF